MNDVNLPPWHELKNEVGPYNNFNIIRGKEFIKIGKDFWMGYFSVLDGSGGLTIGDNVTIASNCGIYTHDSSMYRIKHLVKDNVNGTHVERKPVIIGNNVQIGANSVVLMGVNIGDNVIIGAGSVVTQDIPSNTIAFGNPCKSKKSLYIV